MATKGKVDGACQEPSGRGREPDNQRERIVPDNAGHEASPSSAASVTHPIAAGTSIEDQLRAQEAFYRNIIEGAADVTTLIAPDGTMLYASAALSEGTSLGYTPQEAVGRNALELIHPDDREGVMRAIANDLAAVPTTVEARVLRKDGSWMWVEMRGKGIVGLDGKPVVVAYSRDITERKRAERENALLAAVVESSEDAIISFSTDALITSWNRGAERILGFTADEALGKNFIDLYVAPEMREAVRNMMREDLAASGTPRISRHMESPAIRGDGVRIEVSLSVSGIYDRDGRLLGMSTIMRDISERKQIERENALLAAVVGSSGDGIVSYSSDLRITSWNPGAERILGFTADEAVGKSILDVYVPPRLREHARSVMSEVLEALVSEPKITRRLEVPVIRKDGVEIEAALVLSGIYDRDGEMLGMSAIMNDLSERKQAEREQALLASIVASTDDAVISLGPDGRITSWNRGAEILLGFTAAEAIGQSGVRFMTPPETRDYADHEVGRQLEMAANQRLRERVEVQIQRKDQTLRDVSIVISGIYNFSGARIGLSGIMRDITERKRTEREMAELATIVNATNDAIIGFSPEFRITSWNRGAERAFGIPASAAVGCGFDLCARR